VYGNEAKKVEERLIQGHRVRQRARRGLPGWITSGCTKKGGRCPTM